MFYCLIAFGSSLLDVPESRLLMRAMALPGFKPYNKHLVIKNK